MRPRVRLHVCSLVSLFVRLQAQGADLTIECLVQTLVALQNKHGKLPRKLYLQFDNASDNKCAAVMAFCALLKRMGVVDELHVSFLLRGHTHEGTCAQTFRVHTLHTLHKSVFYLHARCAHVADIDRLFNLAGAAVREAFDSIMTVEAMCAKLEETVLLKGLKPRVVVLEHVRMWSEFLAVGRDPNFKRFAMPQGSGCVCLFVRSFVCLLAHTHTAFAN